MDRRSFLSRQFVSVFTLILASAKTSRYLLFGGPLEIWTNFGGFYLAIIAEKAADKYNRLEIAVETFLPEGQHYNTTVLERLRSAGVIEPNDPLTEFVSVRSMRANDAFIETVSIRTPIKTIRVKGPFVFTVDGTRIDNDSSSRYLIQPKNVVKIFLEPGKTGDVVA